MVAVFSQVLLYRMIDLGIVQNVKKQDVISELSSILI